MEIGERVVFTKDYRTKFDTFAYEGDKGTIAGTIRSAAVVYLELDNPRVKGYESLYSNTDILRSDDQ